MRTVVPTRYTQQFGWQHTRRLSRTATRHHFYSWSWLLQPALARICVASAGAARASETGTMAPKKKGEAPVQKRIFGRFSNSLKMGIVGLPNVGKSSFFNALANLSVPAENYPFCTIEPSVRGLWCRRLLSCSLISFGARGVHGTVQNEAFAACASTWRYLCPTMLWALSYFLSLPSAQVALHGLLTWAACVCLFITFSPSCCVQFLETRRKRE